MSIPQDYVSVDLETTGLNPKIDKIIEIGMVIVRNGQVEQEYSTLVNPYQQLRPETVELTGIRAWNQPGDRKMPGTVWGSAVVRA